MNISDPLHWLQQSANESIYTQPVELDICVNHHIRWDILRTDLIHPVCSGNKFFKLQYYLKEALKLEKKAIATYGGPWSNHLVATAYAAHLCGLKSIGFVRGDEHQKISPTILQCMEQQMEIRFLNRKEYDEKKYKADAIDDVLIIPQGGFGYHGVLGASEILHLAKAASYTHIICAVGSGTMYAGLCFAAMENANIIGLVVHQDDGIEQEIKYLLSLMNPATKNAHLNSMNLEYDQMGGFAKANAHVIKFMNEFYQKTMIPTDFVYTGRLMKWIYESIESGKFPSGSNILAIHSGGLQGNISLKKQSLVF